MSSSSPRVLFFGTPAFAVPALRALAMSDVVEVVGVVTQPDRPAGRGQRLHHPAVKVAAAELGIPALQAATLRDPEARAWLLDQRADLFVVAAFGLILSRATLNLPRLGALNIHASLLPLYRGASPVAAAILEGEQITGISLMQMTAGLDTGPVFARSSVAISVDDTTATLTSRLADLGAGCLMESLPRILAGVLHPAPQSGPGSLTRPLEKEDGRLDWNQAAPALVRRVRAMWPWPRAFTTLPSGALLQVHGARRADDPALRGLPPGSAVVSPRSLRVVCGRDTAVSLEVAQPAGAGPRTALELINGQTLKHGDQLGGSELSVPRSPLIVPFQT